LQDTEALAADDMRRRLPALPGRELRDATWYLSNASRRWRSANRCTPAQLALAWLLAKGDDIVPIPGTKRQKYLGRERGGSGHRADDGGAVGGRADVPAQCRGGVDRYNEQMARFIDTTT
jgi:hypothetical protein